jgi:hypothetical protein
VKLVAFEISRVLGVLAAMGILALWLIFAFANPYDPSGLAFDARLTTAVMIFLAGFGLLAALAGRPFWMAFIFAAMFVPVGFYVLGTPGLFMWIGILELAFLATALLMIFTRTELPNAIQEQANRGTG